MDTNCDCETVKWDLWEEIQTTFTKFAIDKLDSHKLTV